MKCSNIHIRHVLEISNKSRAKDKYWSVRKNDRVWKSERERAGETLELRKRGKQDEYNSHPRHIGRRAPFPNVYCSLSGLCAVFGELLFIFTSCATPSSHITAVYTHSNQSANGKTAKWSFTRWQHTYGIDWFDKLCIFFSLNRVEPCTYISSIILEKLFLSLHVLVPD